jgi:ribonuclease HI
MAIIYTDGGSRGNPGPAAAGYWITEYGKILRWEGVYLGETTNNVAEFRAAFLGLSKAIDLGLKYVEVRADSLLVVEQLKGNWHATSTSSHFPTLLAIRSLFSDFTELTFTHIPREQNAVADFICNITLNANEKATGTGN